MKFILFYLFSTVVSAATITTTDSLWLTPKAVPARCANGELRVDSGDSNKLKKCASNAWVEVATTGVSYNSGTDRVNLAKDTELGSGFQFFAPSVSSLADVPYSFTGDVDTGMALGVDGVARLVFGGSDAMRWNASSLITDKQILNAASSVGSPGYSFSGDTDIGMYRIGADNLGLAVGGSNIVDISSGRVLLQVVPQIPNYATGSLPAAGEGKLAQDTTRDILVVNNGSAWNPVSLVTCAAYITNSGTPTVTNEYGNKGDDCISSITDTGVGNMTVNFTSNYFQTNAICVTTVVSGAHRICNVTTAPSASTVQIACLNNTPADVDIPLNIICMGY